MVLQGLYVLVLFSLSAAAVLEASETPLLVSVILYLQQTARKSTGGSTPFKRLASQKAAKRAAKQPAKKSRAVVTAVAKVPRRKRRTPRGAKALK